MATAVKRKLSGSTDGKAIKVTKTATAGDIIHTSVAGTTPGTYDEIWLWAYNAHTTDVVLTLEVGGTAAPDIIKQTIPFQKGLFLVMPGLTLQNGTVIAAFAGTTNVISIIGFVNAVTD
jgi:hypothetical protein